MDREARKTPNAYRPYAFSYYNVRGIYFTNSAAYPSVFSRMINSLIHELNMCHIMPRLLLLIPDGDIVRFLNYSDYGISKMLAVVIDYLIQQVEKVIECKKTSIRQQKPGSVVALEPKIIWIRMLDKPADANHHALMKKFNSILEETLAGRRNSFIMDGNAFINNSMYTHLGQLNTVGVLEFWRAIDQSIRDFDYDHTPFMPKEVISNVQNNRYHLPPPPPTQLSHPSRPHSEVYEVHDSSVHRCY